MKINFFKSKLLYNCYVFCVVETFLKNKEVLQVEGYTFICHNRGHLHKKAKRGSGGRGRVCA